MAAGSSSNVSLGGEQRYSQHHISVLPVGISSKSPHPGQWTMVKELNMENRDPCEVCARVTSCQLVLNEYRECRFGALELIRYFAH